LTLLFDVPGDVESIALNTTMRCLISSLQMNKIYGDEQLAQFSLERWSIRY